MCGNVSFFGQFGGLTRVLEALYLLEYRAPDSTGVAAVGESGRLNVRRCVGPPKRLIERMSVHPLFEGWVGDRKSVLRLLAKQGIDIEPAELRDCSDYKTEQLYHQPGINIGVGDVGAIGAKTQVRRMHSRRMRQALDAGSGSSSPDFVSDPVRHTFRLVATHVASKVKVDEDVRKNLDEALLARLPAGSNKTWLRAWMEEVAHNAPGQAFAVAVRHFQEHFPGLAGHLGADDWERVGGLTAGAMVQVVMGHGRWAMVGAVTEENAHPFLDRSRTRVVCENGSHNASLMLGMRTEQEIWWHARGIPQFELVHRSENTTEVIAFEWERITHQLLEGHPPSNSGTFLNSLDKWGIDCLEERALRLAMWRLRSGNAHACTFYSQRQPGKLFISSHNKPIAIATRTIKADSGAVWRDLMVASDVNAALMLWPGIVVDEAAQRIDKLQKGAVGQGSVVEKARHEIRSILDEFVVEVIFLDRETHHGEELFACITNILQAGRIIPEVRVSLYDGTPVTPRPKKLRLNPSMAAKRGYRSYTEAHIAEIPEVMERIFHTYVQGGDVKLDSVWQDGNLIFPGLNVDSLVGHFGKRLDKLERLLLIGEGSSWRDAMAAAPLFREVLPGVSLEVYRPVEMLNLGIYVHPHRDLAVEISWSGTTDSVLKVDNWLAAQGLLRLGITGRPQSDLGRRTALSAGTVDTLSGVEVSVATVKGYQAILTVLYLLAIQLAVVCESSPAEGGLLMLGDGLKSDLPNSIREMIEDRDRKERLRQVAESCKDFNKIAVVGSSPIVNEAELKIEELAQIVAIAIDFHAASLRALIKRSAQVLEDRHRILFILNATSNQAVRDVLPVLQDLCEAGVRCIVHTTSSELAEAWDDQATVEVFVSKRVSERLQPLVDAPFFFEFAVALAYARDLSPEEIDRPRNLAKSVTTTGAELRSSVEARKELDDISLAEFASLFSVDRRPGSVSSILLRGTELLSGSLQEGLDALSGAPLTQNRLDCNQVRILTDCEATENAAHIAEAAWLELMGVDLVVEQSMDEVLGDKSDVPSMQLIRTGDIAFLDAQTISMPVEWPPDQVELTGAACLIGLAIRAARRSGVDTGLWKNALEHCLSIGSRVFGDQNLAAEIEKVLSPYLKAGYDKFQVIGGGQDYVSAVSMARSIRMQGFMAEALYADSAWHGPLASVGGPDAEHDTLIIILATDPLFQAVAMVDTQVYRTRNAKVILVVPEGNQDNAAVRGVGASAVLSVPLAPRAFSPIINANFGYLFATQVSRLWDLS